ncbi:MAG: helix-turn-helix domain-containing protein [Euzebya sp.]
MFEQTVVQAYRFALDPTPAQSHQLASFAGAAPVAHNRMLAYLKADLELGKWERQLLGGRLEPAQGWSLLGQREVGQTDTAQAVDARFDDLSTPHHQSVGKTGTATRQQVAA